MKGYDLEVQVAEGLHSLLSAISGVYVDRNPKYPQLLPSEPKPDVRMRVSREVIIKGEAFQDTFDLIAEVKSSGQPRIAHSAIFQLRQKSTAYHTPLLLVFAAPFISQEVRDLCRSEDIGYFDLAGNVRLAHNGFLIEREAADNPYKEVRETRSLFTPKAARVLRLMFREIGPNGGRPWRVMDLASKAGVSLGQVSNIGTALTEAGFAEKDDQGLILTQPGKLLEAWLKAYKLPAGDNKSFYTTLHGNALNEALRTLLSAERGTMRAILSGFSAAQWLAPYARTGSTSLYVDHWAIDRVKDALKLSTASRGENVTIRVLEDDGPLDDAVEAADGIWCTSPIQTCLDLSWAGDRGQEAAAFIHEKWFPWR